MNRLQTILNDKIGRRTEIARSGTKINWDERSADGIGADRPNGFRPSENPVSSVLALSVGHLVPKQITELFEGDPTEKVATRPMFMQYRVPGQTYALFYTHDGNKNVSEVVHYSRANGVAAHYEYAPFGEVTAQVRQGGVAAYDFAALNPWRFSSEYADEVSGTVYYNYRHYEPMAGRWMQRDPIEELYPNIVVGIVDCYLAVLNNPIKLFDLRGLDNPGCDVVGIIPGWESDCRLKCCARHDECYDKNRCSAWSWFDLLNPFKCPNKCDECNIEVFLCTLRCFNDEDLLPYPWEKQKPNGGKYYCAKIHSYVADPKECPN